MSIGRMVTLYPGIRTHYNYLLRSLKPYVFQIGSEAQLMTGLVVIVSL